MLRKKNTASEAQTVVYCGPNLPKLGLVRFAVFRNGYPAHVLKALEKVEELKKMMVPPHKLAEFRKEIERAGSEPHRLFYQILRSRKEM